MNINSLMHVNNLHRVKQIHTYSALCGDHGRQPMAGSGRAGSRVAVWEANSMCGIIGIIAKERVTPGLLEGLRRLEIAVMIRPASRRWSTAASNVGGPRASLST
jgi:hypothetical protein